MSRLAPENIFGYVDTNNSSSTPLGIGGVFNGSWTNIIGAGIIYISTYSDVASATDGLSIEQSTDGVNADHIDNFTVPAATGKTYAINPHATYLRINYTNGAVAQSVFRFQVVLKETGIPSSHRIKDDITTDDDAILVTSILKTEANDLKEYKNISFSNPMPVNGGLLYPHDVNLTYSNMYTFSGSPIDLLDNRWTTIVDSTATNPKQILLEFERPMQTSIIGLVTESGSFSNTVIKYGISSTPDFTLLDESADSTPKQFLIAPSVPITLNRLRFEFHTANTVTLTGMNLAKSNQVIAQIQGEDPNGNIISFGATLKGNQKVSIEEYGDTASIDAFARLRVGQPHTIFDSKQLHDDQPLFYDESLGGSATSSHSSTNAATTLAVTASASDFGIRQSKQRFNYQPGKSQLSFFTFRAPQQTGATLRIGMFDGTGTNNLTANNGIFLEVTASDISWNIAKNGTTTESVSQSSWNVSPLDGTGVSGIDLDMDTTQIGIIDFEWLGVGRVRVGFMVGGIIRYCHYFTHANSGSHVYMSTPNLPVRYDITTDGSATAELEHICCSVISEGGAEQTGILRAVDMGTTHIDANTAGTTYAMIGVRLKSTYYDITVVPEYFSIISLTNDDFRWSLQLNPTINGTFTYSDVTNSSIQRALGATGNDVTAEGIVIDSGYSKSGSGTDRKFVTALKIGATISGVMDELVLCVTPVSSNADYLGSLTIRELL